MPDTQPATVLVADDSATVRALAERLRSAIASTPVSTPAGAVRTTSRIGGVSVLTSGHERDAVLRAADAQLYAAKAAGRDRVQVTALPARC